MAGRRGRRQALGHRLAGGQVLEHDGSRAGAAGLDRHAHDVARRHGDAGEVDGVVGVPLVPGVVGVGAAADGPVDARLQDGVAVGVAVDADPGGAGPAARRVRDGELAGDGVEGLAWERHLMSAYSFMNSPEALFFFSFFFFAEDYWAY